MFDLYLLTKAAHLFALIAWMVGMLYLPRLFVYHCDAAAGSETGEVFKVMERRLLKGIMTPAMIATWIFGILLAVQNPAVFSGLWFPLKLLILIGLTALHMFYAVCRKAFAAGTNTRSQKFYRLVNEVPAVGLVLVLLLAVLKPF